MDIQPTISARHIIRVSPETARLHENFLQTTNNTGKPVLSSVVCTSNESRGTSDKFYKFAFLTGIIATVLQVTSGLAFMALHKLGGSKKFDTIKQYPVKARPAAAIAFSTLGISYLVCAPSTMGAGVNAQQPGIVLHSVLAGALGGALGALTLFDRGGVGTRVKGLLSLLYAPLFAGFANKIDTDFYKFDKIQKRKMNVDFTTDPKTYVNIFAPGNEGNSSRKKFLEFIKFCTVDIKNSFVTSGKSIVKTLKQGKDYITRNRKELPDLISMKPTRESMSLACSLAILGSLPKVIMGSKLGGKKAAAADLVIGAGFLFDSLGMMSVAKTNDDVRKLPMMIGGPMRILGDFGQEKNFLYGLRTLGGAAFEYYYALINKEKDGKLTK